MCLLYVSDVSYLHIYIIFNQHFILGHLYIIGIGVKVNMCVLNISVWCIYIFWVYVGMKFKQLYMSVLCVDVI